MAEGLLKSALQTYGRADIAVASMGIHAPSGPGNGAARHAVEVCAENGIDISSHLSRQLNFDEMKATDLIFVMEGFQKKVIETFVPQVSDSIFLLGAWPGPEKKNSAIDDPIGGSMKDYRKAFTVIKSHIERILPTLLEQLP